MATLLLMRHGKSRWDEGPIRDHERGLAPRGFRAARRMGRFLAGSGISPDVILSSDAERALKTAQLVREAAGWTCGLYAEAGLYGCSSSKILDVVSDLPPSAEMVLLVGHNPAMADAVSQLAGGALLRFPTAAVACFNIDGEWAHLERVFSELRWLLIPRLLRGDS